jgi:hypothetical protein
VSINKAIYTQLAGDTATAALVGDRIWPMQVDDSNPAFPRIVYEVAEDDPTRSYLQGSGLFSAEVTVICAAATDKAAAALAAAVVAALNNAKGTWGGTVVLGCFYRGMTSTPSSPAAGTDVNVFEKELRFQVRYN